MALHSTDRLRSHLQGALGAANISSFALSLSFLIGIFDRARINASQGCDIGAVFAIRVSFCVPFCV